MTICKQCVHYLVCMHYSPERKECTQFKDSIANGVTLDNQVSSSKWISVKDRLPESGKEAVMIALRWGEVDIGWCEDEKWGSEFVNEYEDGEVTHWMPLPEPPKGDDNG